jgi:hypothetical protein
MLVIAGLTGLPGVMAADFGIKAGYQGRDGFKAGVFLGLDLAKNLQVQPELYYSQRKYQYTSFVYQHTFSSLYIPPLERDDFDTVKFIEVPVLLKYRANMRGHIKPVIFGGGYLAFNLEDKGRQWAMYPYYPFVDPEREYSQSEAGVIFGTGFEYGCGKMKMILDIRVNIGLTAMLELYPLGLFGPEGSGEEFAYHYDPLEKKKTRSVCVMVGFSF